MSSMQNAHALVIGIANYQRIRKLPATVLKDARDIYDLLVAPRFCAYPDDHVKLLLDDQATGSSIRQALADLANNNDADSVVFIYLSSHGGRIKDGPLSGEYLLPVDTVYKSAESLADTAISGQEFTDSIRAIPARKVVVILDCCHAGGIGQPKDATVLSIETLPESYYDRLAEGRGRAILASARSTEFSVILRGDENSLFTKHLRAGLQGGIPSEDGLIRIFDLFEYIQPRVTADHSNQHPIFKAELEENFSVGLYLGGTVGVIPKDEQGFRYDAYISYVDREPDSTWVWDTLVPRLEVAGLRIAVSGDVDKPGVARVVNIERGIKQSKRTVLALSEAYLADNMADFENTLALTIGIQEGAYRVLPVKFEALDDDKLPAYLSFLVTLNLAHPRRAEREFERLEQALRDPLPRR